MSENAGRNAAGLIRAALDRLGMVRHRTRTLHDPRLGKFTDDLAGFVEEDCERILDDLKAALELVDVLAASGVSQAPITTVHYQALRNTGDYSNRRIGAWANVEAGQSPESALADLVAWVEAQLDQYTTTRRELELARDSLSDLNYRIQERTRTLEAINRNLAATRQFLTGLGLDGYGNIPPLPTAEPVPAPTVESDDDDDDEDEGDSNDLPF